MPQREMEWLTESDVLAMDLQTVPDAADDRRRHRFWRRAQERLLQLRRFEARQPDGEAPDVLRARLLAMAAGDVDARRWRGAIEHARAVRSLPASGRSVGDQEKLERHHQNDGPLVIDHWTGRGEANALHADAVGVDEMLAESAYARRIMRNRAAIRLSEVSDLESELLLAGSKGSDGSLRSELFGYLVAHLHEGTWYDITEPLRPTIRRPRD